MTTAAMIDSDRDRIRMESYCSVQHLYDFRGAVIRVDALPLPVLRSGAHGFSIFLSSSESESLAFQVWPVTSTELQLKAAHRLHPR